MTGWFRPASWLLGRIDAERAHRLTLWLLRHAPLPPTAPDDPILQCRLFGRSFANPVGIAAGFDKNAEAVAPLLRLGFGFVEFGSVTPRPQAGNPRPRLFRLAEDRAVINRMGFNNDGAQRIAGRLAVANRPAGVLGANLGANKDSADRLQDYVVGLQYLAPLADYITINVSSPNTPGLRTLQGAQELDALLDRLLAARAQLARPVPLLLKIAPDLAEADLQDIAVVALRRGLDGLIVGNTTIGHREGLKSRARGEPGGLSGAPLFAPSTAVLATMYRLTEGGIPLVGTGGIASGTDAYAKIRAGASLVQLYTALVYQGPALLAAIKRDLAARLRADGFGNITEAVGSGLR